MKENGFYILIMRESIERIFEYTRGGKIAFFSSTLIQDAVLRNLEKISDAASKIDERLREEHPEIEWRELAELRKVLLYPDRQLVWTSIESYLKPLFDQLSEMRSMATR